MRCVQWRTMLAETAESPGLVRIFCFLTSRYMEPIKKNNPLVVNFAFDIMIKETSII